MTTLEQLDETAEHIRGRLRELADEPFEPEVLVEIHELSSWLDNIEYAKWALERRRAALERLLNDWRGVSP